MGPRAGDMPVCTRVRVVRVTRYALLVADEGVEEWVPLTQIFEGGDISSASKQGATGVMMIPRWLAQDRGFRWW